MAVPKGKISKQRGNSRFASNYKVSAPSLVECPQCHELKQSHRVCGNCGYYDKTLVIEQDTKKKD